MSAIVHARSGRRGLASVLVLAACAAATSARAQTPASEPSAQPVPAAPSAEPATPIPEPSPLPVAAPHEEVVANDALLEARYHGAFEALARGERDVAVRLLQSIVDEAPQHSLAAHARKLLSDLAATKAPPPAPSSWLPESETAAADRAPAPPKSIARDQHPTSIARAELVFFQTVHGIALGAELCAIAGCNGSQPWVLSLMLGAGGGFAASWHFSRHGVTPGLSRALTDGVLWGAANGLGLAVALDHRDEAASIGAFLAGGQLVGLGLAGLAYDQLEPSAGQVSLSMSGGLWSLTAASELVGAFDPHFQSHTWAWLLIGTGNAGVFAGALLAHSVPMTTSRVLLIDAGGLLGTLSGLGLSVLAQGDNAHPAPTLIPGLVGTLTGLGVAYCLTQDWDRDERANANALHLGLAPMQHGAVASLSGYW